MPTYLYECPICGEFEHVHSITDVLETCPMCEEKGRMDPVKVKRLISGGGGFILSAGGCGWSGEGYSK